MIPIIRHSIDRCTEILTEYLPEYKNVKPFIIVETSGCVTLQRNKTKKNSFFQYNKIVQGQTPSP